MSGKIKINTEIPYSEVLHYIRFIKNAQSTEETQIFFQGKASECFCQVKNSGRKLEIHW